MQILSHKLLPLFFAQLVGSICGASIALATTGKGHVIGSVDLPSDMTRDD